MNKLASKFYQDVNRRAIEKLSSFNLSPSAGKSLLDTGIGAIIGASAGGLSNALIYEKPKPIKSYLLGGLGGALTGFLGGDPLLSSLAGAGIGSLVGKNRDPFPIVTNDSIISDALIIEPSDETIEAILQDPSIDDTIKKYISENKIRVLEKNN